MRAIVRKRGVLDAFSQKRVNFKLQFASRGRVLGQIAKNTTIEKSARVPKKKKKTLSNNKTRRTDRVRWLHLPSGMNTSVTLELSQPKKMQHQLKSNVRKYNNDWEKTKKL
jgi:hypothetical protein